MIKKISQSFGPLLVLIIVAVIAITSLVSQEKTQLITNSIWFLVFGIIITIRSIAAAISSLRSESNIKRTTSIIIHLGIVIGLIGVGLNQRSRNNGYVFLEFSKGGKNYYLNKNLKTIEELSRTLYLDSLTNKYTKAFEPAPVAWLHYNSAKEAVSFVLTYNHPFDNHGIQFLFANVVEPGFPHSYALTVNKEEYLLMHNQYLQLPNGTIVYSYAYDTEQNRLGFMINHNEYWLQTGETKQINNYTITLESADFSKNQGVILLVKDIKQRAVIYAGFGFMLLGLFVYLFEKRKL